MDRPNTRNAPTSHRRHAAWLPLLAAALGFALFGCSASNSASPAAGAATPAPGTPAAADNAAPAAADPAATATPEPEQGKPVVSIRAVDPVTGKTVVLNFKTIYFEFDEHALDTDDMPVIRHNADLLKRSPALRVVIEGNCDERGSTEYNLALGERRALAVQDALQAEGIEKKRLMAVSNGEEQPADRGHTEKSWEQNRRSEFRKS